jgi:hypothetical protein
VAQRHIEGAPVARQHGVEAGLDAAIEPPMHGTGFRPHEARAQHRAPPMSRIGMNTATSDTLIDTIVKAISPEPFSAASNGVMLPSTWR